MPAARIVLIAISAFALAMAGPATADDGRLTAGAVQYDAQANQSGELGLFFVSDAVLDAQGRSASGARPWIDLEAKGISAVVYEESYVAAALPGPVFDEQAGPRPGRQATPSTFGASTAHLTGFQPGFELHIYALDGTIGYAAESQGGVLQTVARAQMSYGSFGNDAIQGRPPEENPSNFARVERAGPWVLHRETAPKASLTFEGDFIVEMSGISLQVDEDGSTQELRSGRWTSPVDPSAPPQSSDVVYSVTERFLRLHLTDAVLEFATASGSPDLFWAASSASADFQGRVALVDAQGDLQTPGGTVSLRHERHVLPEASRLGLVPLADDTLQVQVSPSPIGTNGGRLASAPAPASAALIGTGAVLALGAAIGIGLLRRVLRLPAMADVETAIEEGEYRKAARLAGRILARLPGSEEALLGRAIALSKAGQPQAVVAELTRHLASRPASDGTLHYVLGLAQLETGQAPEGQASLREAVRLTPALHAEVAPRLGKAFSVAQTTTRETHGYA